MPPLRSAQLLNHVLHLQERAEDTEWFENKRQRRGGRGGDGNGTGASLGGASGGSQVRLRVSFCLSLLLLPWRRFNPLPLIPYHLALLSVDPLFLPQRPDPAIATLQGALLDPLLDAASLFLPPPQTFNPLFPPQRPDPAIATLQGALLDPLLGAALEDEEEDDKPQVRAAACVVTLHLLAACSYLQPIATGSWQPLCWCQLACQCPGE